MALTLGDNFSYQGAKPLDARLIYSTVASMKAVADATMYDGCMAYCTATDKTYQWKSTNTVDETTGKWREYSGGSSLPSGGTTGQLLAKHSNTDGDVEWVNAPSSIPNGGTTGQALVKHSNTDKDVEWGTVGGLGYEEKILGAQNFTYNDATLVSNGETKVFYSKWNGGSTAGDNAGIPSSPGSVDRYYYIEMTKNTAGTVFVQRCRKFYTQNSTNYVQTYERRCTSSGGTWTYADWIETTGDDTDTSKLYSTDDTAETTIADADYFPFYDTSATAKKKSLWSNIVDTLKNTFQQKLTAGTNVSINSTTNVIDASFPIVVNKFDKANLYSTTEKVVGCWTDGRPVYQKTIQTEVPTTASDGTDTVGSYIAIGASVREFVDIRGIVERADACISPNVAKENASSNEMAIRIQGTTNSATSNKNSIVLANSWKAMNGYTAYVTIQYTKTTDAANSFKYADENDYSTTEHIVGTFTDGKPVYQKYLSLGAGPTAGQKKSYSLSVSNVKKYLKCQIWSDWGNATFGAIPNINAHGWIDSNGTVQIQSMNNTDLSSTNNYAIIQYTKTTD